MLFRILADAIVVAHLGFILFVVFGGLLAWKWRAAAAVHLPAAVWGALIEFQGWVCPLTPLENRLRELGGGAGYGGGFVEHYLLPVIYPGELTRGVQIALGLLVVAINAAIYARLIQLMLRRRARRR